MTGRRFDAGDLQDRLFRPSIGYRSPPRAWGGRPGQHSRVERVSRKAGFLTPFSDISDIPCWFQVETGPRERRGRFSFFFFFPLRALPLIPAAISRIFPSPRRGARPLHSDLRNIITVTNQQPGIARLCLKSRCSSRKLVQGIGWGIPTVARDKQVLHSTTGRGERLPVCNPSTRSQMTVG